MRAVAAVRTGGVVVASAVAAMPLVHLVVSAWPGLTAGGMGVEVWRAASVSMLLACVQTLVGLLLASMAAFALVFGRVPMGGWLVAGVVGLAALPPHLLLPGGFELVVGLGLFDRLWAVLVPGSLNVLAILLYRAAMMSVPRELVEAARVDGCGEWGAWWRVVMPVVAPTTAACAVLSFTSSWNAVVWPMLVLQDPGLQTLPMKVATLAAGVRSPADETALAAHAVVGMLPLMAVFMWLQREFLPVLHGRGCPRVGG